MGVLSGYQRSDGQPLLPTVVSADIPIYPRLAHAAKVRGTFRYKVTTDSDGVTSVEPLERHGLFDPSAIDNLKSWRFTKHQPVQFESTFRFTLGQSRCVGELSVADEPDVVRMEFPSALEIREASSANCDFSWGGDVGQDMRPRDVFERVYGVRVTADPLPDFRCCLPVKPAPPQPPKPVREELVVSRATVSGYPAMARARGIDGLVRLFASSTGQVVVAEGPPELAEPTLAAVRTWQMNTPTEPAEITFTYRLVPGDCTGGGPVVTTTPLRRHITVTAKRVVPCGAGAQAK